MRKILKIQSELSVQSMNKNKVLIDNHYITTFKSVTKKFPKTSDYSCIVLSLMKHSIVSCNNSIEQKMNIFIDNYFTKSL